MKTAACTTVRLVRTNSRHLNDANAGILIFQYEAKDAKDAGSAGSCVDQSGMEVQIIRQSKRFYPITYVYKAQERLRTLWRAANALYMVQLSAQQEIHQWKP